MKKIGYSLVKVFIKAALHLYFGKIKMHGLENVPKDAPVLFLPNHQNALLDVLLIAVDCNRKPYFLTRSDVFKGKFLQNIFSFFQMIPIYRIRDGRETLKNNQAVFDYCTELLIDKEALLMFPEANHNLQRRVRPLSKGFTRILFNTFDKSPETDIQLITVGLNYQNAENFPDKAALYFSSPIEVKQLYNPTDEKKSVASIKKRVSDSLKKGTTHIPQNENYDEKVQQLNALGADYLKPKEVNAWLQNETNFLPTIETKNNSWSKLLQIIFEVFNFPVLFVWRTFVKPKVWEPEFMGTIRFAFALFAYPIYYFLLFFLIRFCGDFSGALFFVIALFLFNGMYVRLK